MTQAMYQKSVSHSVAQTMKGAVTAAVMTAILTIPVLGQQLKLDGYKVESLIQY